MTVQNTARMILGCLSDTYRRGFMLFAIGLPAVALVIVPEFAQHAAEIQNGMFDSRAGAQAFANTPLRWNFGYVKLAGLLLAILACARFWWTHEQGGRWWSPGGIAWGRLLGGTAIITLVSLSTWPFRGVVQDSSLDILDLILSLLTLPLVFYILSGLFGDRSIPLSVMLRRSWPWVLLLALLVIFAFVPPQYLHGLLHKWAIGQSRAMIWLLMIVDSIVVGLLASLVGAALYSAYGSMAQKLRPNAPA